LIYSKKVTPSGKVFAFEPDKSNIHTFNKNLSLNANTSNISLNEKGLWDKSDNIDFFEAGTVGSSVYFQDEKSVKITIPVISIYDFVDSLYLSKLDFIKMDIEGAEIEALKGAYNTIKSLKPHLAVASYHIVENEVTYKKVEEFFSNLN